MAQKQSRDNVSQKVKDFLLMHNSVEQLQSNGDHAGLNIGNGGNGSKEVEESVLL